MGLEMEKIFPMQTPAGRQEQEKAGSPLGQGNDSRRRCISTALLPQNRQQMEKSQAEIHRSRLSVFSLLKKNKIKKKIKTLP